MAANRAKIARLLTLSLACVVVLLLGQNCGDVRLKGRILSSLSHAPEMLLTIDPPTPAVGDYRVVVFMDQSYSMIWGKCLGDLDSTAPNGSGFSCATPEAGVDPEGDRYRVLRKWINELPANSKIAILPFSGGIMARPRPGDYIKDSPLLFNFKTKAEALLRLYPGV